MSLIRKLFGPKSKYDKSLPYTYEAQIDVLCWKGAEPMYSYYYSDTICGLVGYLEANNITPEGVEIFGIYLNKEIPLEKKYCLSEDGKWLKRPDICKSLEEHFEQTMEEQYKGHVANGECAFDDRNRVGSGPY
ncbi:MAG: hypothetical protein KJN64_02925 [Ignavibacteria bacterium]|nr:hypothetical protein [Ignavibacteria bacterium]MBT8391950.1 hypothetical protein [Ignavibacteria bacterium]NNJ52187.1 hypothetical protein [Ignavibacteriaceae bacterium]NNL21770.1 hypothetical protein [Ignavibacteriaceae bacterium]